MPRGVVIPTRADAASADGRAFESRSPAVLKDTSRASALWTRNVQMAIFSTPFALLTVVCQHGLKPWQACLTPSHASSLATPAFYRPAFKSLWRQIVADGASILQHGPWEGFNRWLLATITLGALGGLAVSFVFKFADNILKAFAVGLSM